MTTYLTSEDGRRLAVDMAHEIHHVWITSGPGEDLTALVARHLQIVGSGNDQMRHGFAAVMASMIGGCLDGLAICPDDLERDLDSGAF